jgi:quaternary ammonium compound-resistance protein SugE
MGLAWFLVVVAGLLETGFAVMLKESNGFTRILPTILFAVFALGSFGLLTIALKWLAVGPAYPVWTGIGAGATVVVPVSEMHGWRVGRVVDPFGHHWEIGREL